MAVTPALAATVPDVLAADGFVLGPVGPDVGRRCYELGATVAANL